MEEDEADEEEAKERRGRVAKTRSSVKKGPTPAACIRRCKTTAGYRDYQWAIGRYQWSLSAGAGLAVVH